MPIRYPVTPMQHGMLLQSLAAPDAGIYVAQTVSVFEDVRPELLRAAWPIVFARHPVLRTGFVWEEADAIEQVVSDDPTLDWHEEDARDLDDAARRARLDEILAADRRRGFDLRQPPLMRMTLLRTGRRQYTVIWTSHHIILDGWSASIVVSELFTVYRALATGAAIDLPPAPPFALFVDWLRQRDTAAAERFWRARLRQTPSSRTAGGVSEGARVSTAAVQQSCEQYVDLAPLQDLTRRARITLSTLVQGAWALVLGRETSADEVVFGVTVSGRPEDLPDAERMAGLFINTIPARVAMPGGLPARAWLRQLHAQFAEDRSFAYAPLPMIQQWSGLADTAALFDSAFLFENYPTPGRALGRAAGHAGGASASSPVSGARTLEVFPYPLTATAEPDGDALHLTIQYDPDRFTSPRIARMLGRWAQALAAMVREPDGAIGDLDLLTGEERTQLLDAWQPARRDVSDGHFLDLFDHAVARRSDAPALVGDEGVWSYRELDARANQLAHALLRLARARRAQGLAAPDETGRDASEWPVAVLLARGFDSIAALLAIWKAGAAFVPIDPSYPAERLRFQLEDSAASIVITDSRHQPRLPPTRASLLLLDRDAATIAAESAACPTLARDRVARDVDALAYIIYTSGSTGRPKGVLVPHTGLATLAHEHVRLFAFHDEACMLQFSSPGFDGSIGEIVCALTGGRLCVADPARLPPYAESIALLRRHRVTVMAMPPSVLAAMPREAVPELRTVVLVGEDHTGHDVAFWQPGHNFINAYGPTETTVYVTFDRHDPSRAFTLGRPMTNARAYVLDRRGHPVPVGATGELYIGGPGVTRGYHNRAALTAERFVPDPFAADQAGARLYRTGDRVRWLEDGRLEFLGRFDDQVKLRGFRVEPGEIAAVLQQAPGVRQAAVLVRDRQGDLALVAYVVPAAADAPVSADDLLAFARQRLPRYMVPSACLVLDALPLTASGKIDRAALLALPLSRPASPDREPPAGAREEQIAAIWRQVLGVSDIGRHDNFFDLGGHSLLAFKVAVRLREVSPIPVPIELLLRAPTISELAAALDAAPQPDAPQAAASTAG